MNATARELGDRTRLSKKELRNLLCRDCDFFREDHEDELECASFRMLRTLLEREVFTPRRLAAALGAEQKQEQA